MDEELRIAILNRDFERAQSIIAERTKAIASEVKAATGAVQRRRILEEAVDRAEQDLCLARVIRAHIASELKANSASFLYAESELEQPRWRVSA